MTEFILHHYIDNEWKPTNTKVYGVVKEVYYYAGGRVRKFEDGNQIYENLNWIYLASDEKISQIIGLIINPPPQESNDDDNFDEDKFYDDDKPSRPIITFNEYERDHDHW